MSGEKQIIPLGNDRFVLPCGPSPAGGDIHENIRVDKEGNIFDAHTTVRIPGGKAIHIDWKK